MAATVRRRLGAAARAAGHKLTIRRAGDEVYFWAVEAQSSQREAQQRPKGVTAALTCPRDGTMLKRGSIPHVAKGRGRRYALWKEIRLPMRTA